MYLAPYVRASASCIHLFVLGGEPATANPKVRLEGYGVYGVAEACRCGSGVRWPAYLLPHPRARWTSVVSLLSD